MDSQIPQPMRPNIGGQLPVQVPPQMMMGMRPPVSMINPFSVLPEQEEKRR